MAKQKAVIKWHVEKRRLKDLKDFEHNPRKIRDKDFQELKKSIDIFGYAQLININLDNMIISGHQRVKVLREQGTDENEEIEVLVPDRMLDNDDFRELNIRFNKNQGEFDIAKLTSGAFDIDNLLNVGFESWELGVHNKQLQTAPPVQPVAPVQPAAQQPAENPHILTGNPGERIYTPSIEGEENDEPQQQPGENPQPPVEPVQPVLPPEPVNVDPLVVFDMEIRKSMRTTLYDVLTRVQAKHGYQLKREAFEHIIQTAADQLLK